MIKEGQIIKLLKRKDAVDCQPGIVRSMDEYFGKYQVIKKTWEGPRGDTLFTIENDGLWAWSLRWIDNSGVTRLPDKLFTMEI